MIARGLYWRISDGSVSYLGTSKQRVVSLPGLELEQSNSLLHGEAGEVVVLLDSVLNELHASRRSDLE
jgi:hypothetical protein